LVREEPEDLEKLGIRFEEESDQLDDLRHARVTTPAGRVFALVRYRRSPQPGTEIVTQHDSPDLVRDLEDVLGVLKLKDDDILWEHPAIVAARVARGVQKQLRPALWSAAIVIAVLQTAALWLMARGHLGENTRAFSAALVIQALAVLVSLLSAPLLIRFAEHSSRHVRRNDSTTDVRKIAG